VFVDNALDGGQSDACALEVLGAMESLKNSKKLAERFVASGGCGEKGLRPCKPPEV
jgi:hypothetical protein